MAEFPKYEEMCKKVAEKALDEFLYHGKSIREWIQIIASKDAISRQVVLDVLKEKWNMYSNANDAMQESIDTIEVLKPVTPQQKTGRWVDITNKHGTVIAIRCSRCKESPKYAIKSDYCPNCGAKMQEPQESEDKE